MSPKRWAATPSSKARFSFLDLSSSWSKFHVHTSHLSAKEVADCRLFYGILEKLDAWAYQVYFSGILQIAAFNDKAMIVMQSEGDKVIIAERGQLVFVFNFHPTNSYSDYRVGCPSQGPYKASCCLIVSSKWEPLEKQPLWF